MAHLESIIIPAHHTIWNGYNKRELRIEFALPEKGTNEETGFFIFAPGFGGHIDSNVYKKMRSQFSDLYNVVTIQCDYFGNRFMQGVDRFTFNDETAFLAKIFLDHEIAQIQNDSSNLIPLLQNKDAEFPVYAKLDETLDEFADMSYMQAIDIITAIEAVKVVLTKNGFQYNEQRIIGFGQSQGAYLLHLSNRLVPHLFSHIVDLAAWVSPVYLKYERCLYTQKLCVYFNYLAKDIIQDQEALTLHQLYKNFENGAFIYSAIGTTDNLVNPADKKKSLSELQHVQFEIVDNTKVDNVIFKSTNHGMDADFLELVKYVLKKKPQHHNINERQLCYTVTSANTKIHVDYRYGLPLFQLEDGHVNIDVALDELAKQTKRNTKALEDYTLKSKNIIAEMKQQQPTIEYIDTKIGSPTIALGGYLLHSKYDPIKEAEKIAEKEIEEDYLHVLFGYGYGYVAQALKAKLKDAPLLVYEPAMSGIEKTMTVEGVTVISNKRLFQEQVRAYHNEYDTNMKLICSPNYDKLFPMEQRNINLIVKESYLADRMRRNTISFFSDIWQQNVRRNLQYLNGAESLNRLYKRYTQPVIVASGGPSLTKQLPLLKKIADQVVIIAAGSTTKSLLAAGIEPDYVLTIDGAQINYDLHFKNLEIGKSKLITALSSHYKITEKYQNNLYFYGMGIEDTILDYCEEKLGIKIPIMLNGGSCAHTALHVATFISSGPVALIGQDLAFTNNQTHAADNAGYVEIDENWLIRNHAYEVEGYNGDKVYTDLTFNSMRQQFEEIYEVLKNNHVIYNCTEGGSKIEGMPQKTFQDFCQEYADLLQTKELQDASYEKQTVTLTQLKKFFEDEMDVYRQLEHQLQRALTILREKKSNIQFTKPVLKKLDKIDEKLIELYDQVLLDSVIYLIILETRKDYKKGKNETLEQTYERVYNQSKALYEKLLVVFQKARRYTQEVLLEIEERGTRS
ncbi:6-hydroxymethylpterin diphosphokinase MptE-like protein [Lysinibacillus capsici]|uniref:6-hydroxymethylpterin diphosphokinase MptE-like protein n=1 Tax=Lysinibacillus capsici TaxID=2115968 RepID=UPI002153769B|nr:6-hydroxymethylpterin diphosphokinase MptE-like protein [Lysinibacillus capsici]MCR6523195.1 DUF2920 family protein [Lysinibacillus capsici]